MLKQSNITLGIISANLNQPQSKVEEFETGNWKSFRLCRQISFLDRNEL